MDDREFGRLEGKVDETIRRVGRVEEAINGLRQAGSAEHAEVGRKLDALGRDFRSALEQRDVRIDSLESSRDKASGAFQLGSLLKGAIAGVLTFIGILIGEGRHP